VSAREPAPALLLLAPSAYPLGGVATWIDYLVPGLAAHGWRVTVALLAGAHHDVSRYLARHPFERVVTVENRGGSREGRVRSLATAMRRAAPDVVLSVNVADVEAAVERCRRRGERQLRLATTQHGVQEDFYAHLRRRRSAVDAAICSNRLSAALASAYSGVPKERVYYASYGVPNPAVPARPTAGAERLRILWVGRFERAQKRVLDLGPICDELERRGLDYRLDLAGSGPDEPALRALLSERETAGRVRFLGEVAPEAMADRAYADRDVLLITSEWETGPIVAWEAVSRGLLVVTSRFLGSGLEGAWVDRRTCLTFETGDARAAADALALALEPALRADLSAQAATLVRGRYAVEASVAAWNRALESILARAPLPATGASSSGPPAGRLDRYLGAWGAEAVRRALRIENRQGSPGDEWPHAYPSDGEGRFLEMARALDRGERADDSASEERPS